eukprot:c11306_g1_i1.p1 GENE.c11306_g1_i1~~c11306_g1_i1.p1  ORF type:complete len:373 (+),score=82.76 c11306_g1_i1:75-1121(+)
MIRSIFGGSSASASQGQNSARTSDGAQQQQVNNINLLVIQSDAYDWQELLRGVTLRDGRGIRVVQCGWEDMLVSADSYSRNRINVDVRGQRVNGQPKQNSRFITFAPDFVLIRNEVYMPHVDHRNLLFGLMFANIPSVNSLKSIYLSCERPIVQAELNRLNKQHGNDVFPVVEQSYFSSNRSLMYGNKFPAVVKIGAAHAGIGKMCIEDHHVMEDFRSVLAMTEGKYCTAEPFLNGEFDLRIQKIGNNFRAFRRTTISGNWKTNTGSAHVESVPMTDTYRRWIELASEMFGGLDICTVDAIHERDTNREVILEVNGTSSGLCPETEAEDNQHIVALILEKMNALFCPE